MTGEPLPDRIANAPELKPGLELYLSAFFDLNTERSHAMGITLIPWSSIANYARFYDFDEEMTERLFYLIQAMDAAHTARLQKKYDAQVKHGKNAARPRK